MSETISILLGFALLTGGGEVLVRGAVGVAQRLGVSPLLVGLVLVGFGTSTPELLGRLVASDVAERMKRVAQAMLQDEASSAFLADGRPAILAKIRDREAELRRLGVERLSLFGSVARGDWDETSDIDLAVSLAPGFSEGGFDYVGRMEMLQERWTQILGRPVDLIEEPVETADLQERIDEERVIAF